MGRHRQGNNCSDRSRSRVLRNGSLNAEIYLKTDIFVGTEAEAIVSKGMSYETLDENNRQGAKFDNIANVNSGT